MSHLDESRHAPEPPSLTEVGFTCRKAVSALLLAAGLLAVGSGCGEGGTPGDGEALFSPELLPDLLVEADAVALPPAIQGNRLLSGWRPAEIGGEKAVWPGFGGGRIELVHLVPRPRTLVLDLELGGEGPAGRTVRVRAAGRELGTVPLADPLEIPLPPDLPRGRVSIDLAFEGGEGVAPPVIPAARLLPAAAAGELRWEEDRLVQSGVSLVEQVRRIPAGARLVGTYVPPAGGGSDRRSELVVEGPGGERVATAAFTGGWWARLRGRRAIDLPLGEEAGLRRFRFLATGPPGPPARWEGLRILAPETGGAPPPALPAALPALPPPPRLVIVYVMDALRADWVGHLGGPAGASPTLDRLAAAGATFLRHQSVAPNTLPSTKALFIGRSFVEGGGWKLPAAGEPTLAELFRRAGYRTGLFSGNVHVGPAYGTDRGFDYVAPDLGVEAGTAPYNDNAARVHRAALAWLRRLAPGEKAFAYLHTIHPHNPYDPPPETARSYTAGIPSAIDGSTRTLLDLKHRRRKAGPADRRRLRGLYTGSFAYNDAELGRFLARLERLVPLEETLLAVTSDHGEELFDHGGVLHGYTLYEEMLRIPLVLYAPGRIEPVRVDLPSDTLDLHATLLELCGLDGSAASEGRSLVAAIAGRGGEPKVLLAAASSLQGGIFSARSDDWKVIWAPRTGRRWGMGEGLGRSRDPELHFHLASDPDETVNLAGDGGLEAAWLRSRLLAWIEQGLEASREGEPAEQDPATLRRLRALGYVD